MSKIKYLFGMLLAIFATVFIFPSVVSAAPKYKIHIGISPIQEKIELSPGETKTGSVKIQNLGSEEFKYKVGVSPYQVKGKNYEQDLVNQSSSTKISKWITLSTTNGTLKPGEETHIEYTITVPNDVPSGGQYAVITASTSDGSDDGTVHSTKSVGSKIIGRVSGVTRETGEIVSNHLDTFFLNPPIKATSLVKSSSNVDITAKYSLNVYNFFGGTLAYASDGDESFVGERTIFPDTEYLNSATWEGSPHLGIFKVRQTVELLGKISTSEKIVILCPLWLIIVISAIFIVLIVSIITTIKKAKTKRQMARY